MLDGIRIADTLEDKGLALDNILQVLTDPKNGKLLNV